MMQTEELATQLPTRGRQIKFTPERLEQIRNLVERGKSREEIAELIGVTVGSLQVTCSKLGISLRRVVFSNGMGLLRRGGPHSSNGTSTYTPSRGGGGVSLPPINEQAQQNSQSGPAKQHHQERVIKNEVDLANLALRMQYRGGDTKGAAMTMTNASPPARGRRVKFTPQVIEQIKGFVAVGISREEIANRVGVTVGSLQVTCSRLGISLRRIIFANGSGRRTADVRGWTIATPGSVGIAYVREQKEVSQPATRATPLAN